MYVLPGDILGGKYGAVVGKHPHAVTGVVNAGSYIVAVLCFRLQLVVFLYSVDGWLEERPHLPGGGGEPYHISYRDLSAEFGVVAVRFRTWHTTSAHKDG